MLVNVTKTDNVAGWCPDKGFHISNTIKEYECNRCGEYIHESYPHFNDKKNDFHLCWDCTFIEGKIKEKEFLGCVGISLPNAHATIRDGEVVIWVGNKPPWERTDRDYRNTKEYRLWRKSVFERDGYTCQHCNQVGGELNAHHIKPFKEYKQLRYEIDNGLTLCVKCHRGIHKKNRR